MPRHRNYPSKLLLLALGLTSCVYHEFAGPGRCEDNPVLVEISRIGHVTSCAQQDGTVELTAEAGAEPYAYSKDGILFQSHSRFQNLSGGLYIFSVSDAFGCIDTIHARIANFASDLSAEVNVSANRECLTPNGSITVMAQSGTPPYLYSIDQSDFAPQPTFTGLRSGQYSVRVKDSNLCVFNLVTIVPREDTGVSWATNILPIIETRCAKSGCHDSHSGRVNFSTYSNVYDYRYQIRTRVASGSMPFDGPLPDDQKATILCWIDDGAKNN